MSKIKTREIAEKGIKALDKATVVGERMKSAYIRAREKAVDTVSSRQESANEYAGEQVEHTAEDLSREVIYDAGSGAQKAVQKGREVFQKQREKAAKKKEQEPTAQEDVQFRQDEPTVDAEHPIPEGNVPESMEPPFSADETHRVTVLRQDHDVVQNGVEPVSRNERLPQKVERLPRQTPDDAPRRPVMPKLEQARRGQTANSSIESIEPDGVEAQFDVSYSPVERGRNTVKERAGALADERRMAKGRFDGWPDVSEAPAESTKTEAPTSASSVERGRELAKDRAEARAATDCRKNESPVRSVDIPSRRAKPEMPMNAPSTVSFDTAKPLPSVGRPISSSQIVRNETGNAARRAAKTTRRTIKTAQTTAKSTVKTAERTAKTSIKTAEATAKAAHKSAQAAAKAERMAARTARAAAKAAAVTAKAAAKAVAAAVKATITAIKGLITTIAAGGSVVAIPIIVITLVGLLIGSVFGIFFSGEDSGSGQTMQTAVQEINAEYENKLAEIRTANPYDILEMSGSRAIWREVLAVYAVKTNYDPDNPQEVASMDDSKKALLKEIFWAMHTISYTTAIETRDIVSETDDGSGNIVETSTPTEVTVLYITVTHKTAAEMADSYGFNDEQKAQLAELLDGKYQSLWSAVLYGIGAGDGQIVAVALAQLGNSGDIYWSWYGFNSRVEWCACFVSWCANECGYIETGVIPKFSSCSRGAEWFQDHGQWQDNSYEPRPGDIIFFDWDKENVGQDGTPDHVGIVEKVENGYVYTVEGNSGDKCRENRYAVGYYEIFGYGVLCV